MNKRKAESSHFIYDHSIEFSPTSNLHEFVVHLFKIFSEWCMSLYFRVLEQKDKILTLFSIRFFCFPLVHWNYEHENFLFYFFYWPTVNFTIMFIDPQKNHMKRLMLPIKFLLTSIKTLMPLNEHFLSLLESFSKKLFW